ncbi:ribonuclease H-like domain-containing protein, partial [Tanacetum coccineum]
GTLSRYKARLVANGSTQLEGVDVDEILVQLLNLSCFFQKKYAVEIIDRAHMVNCNPSRTLIDTESKLGSDGDPVSDPTLYQSLAGSLQYLTFTRPDISYAVQQIWLLIGNGYSLKDKNKAKTEHENGKSVKSQKVKVNQKVKVKSQRSKPRT